MAGACDSMSGSAAGKTCHSNIECGGGNCTARTDNVSPQNPLRLNDLSCRYRQWPEDPTTCGDDPDPTGDLDGVRRAFPFQFSNFPCTRPAGSPARHPVPRTPHLDALATQGAVFPRTHVGGDSCAVARGALLYGKFQRHLRQEVPVSLADRRTIAYWITDPQQRSDCKMLTSPMSSCTTRYKPLLFGKSEAALADTGGFEGGDENSHTKLGRFDCSVGSCTTDAWWRSRG